jgi:hypothetical protein
MSDVQGADPAQEHSWSEVCPLLVAAGTRNLPAAIEASTQHDAEYYGRLNKLGEEFARQRLAEA